MSITFSRGAPWVSTDSAKAEETHTIKTNSSEFLEIIFKLEQFNTQKMHEH